MRFLSFYTSNYLSESVLSRKKLFDALREMGPKAVADTYRDGWSKNNPDWGMCYRIVEFIKHYVNKDLDVYKVKTQNGRHHWFLKDSNGKIIDYAKNQFKKSGEKVNYDEAQPASLGSKPHSNATRLARLMGYIEDKKD